MFCKGCLYWLGKTLSSLPKNMLFLKGNELPKTVLDGLKHQPVLMKAYQPFGLFFYIRIYFIRISRLQFEKFQQYFKNRAEAQILKRIDIILWG